MAMLPIFICGLVLGFMFGLSYVKYKAGIPSNVKLSTLENAISRLKEDNEILEHANRDLISQLSKLKEEMK